MRKSLLSIAELSNPKTDTIARKHRCDFVEKIHDIQNKTDRVDDVLYRLKREGKCDE